MSVCYKSINLMFLYPKVVRFLSDWGLNALWATPWGQTMAPATSQGKTLCRHLRLLGHWAPGSPSAPHTAPPPGAKAGAGARSESGGGWKEEPGDSGCCSSGSSGSQADTQGPQHNPLSAASTHRLPALLLCMKLHIIREVLND